MPSWKPSLRFTIRGVLLLTLLVAVVLAMWRCRPSPWLEVELTARGTVRVQDREVPVAELAEVFRRDIAWRKRWWMSGSVVLRAGPDTVHLDCMEIIDLASASGYDSVMLTVTDP